MADDYASEPGCGRTIGVGGMARDATETVGHTDFFAVTLAVGFTGIGSTWKRLMAATGRCRSYFIHEI